MAKKDGIKMDIKVDSRTYDFFQRSAPHKLKQARENAVEACGMVWADESKDITTRENHIVTSLYVNSIGYVTGSPATQADTIHQMESGRDQTTLKTGSSVAYASALEKRYSIMARGLDLSEDRMNKVSAAQVKKALSL